MANTVSLKYLDDAFGTGNQAYAYISVAGDVVDTGNVKKIANGITYSDAPLPSRHWQVLQRTARIALSRWVL